MHFIEQIYSALRKLTNYRQIVVAYSGGMDSHVLLAALAEARNHDSSLYLSAIHINHGIHKDADAWAEHCQKISAALNIPCRIENINVPAFIAHSSNIQKKKPSLETAARHLRYEALERIVPQDAALLTAHHADDQAETLLLQLLRGAGPKGLAAIPAHSMLGSIELLRPMLAFSRQEVLEFAKQRELRWIEDESNLDLSIERNYLRQKIIPELKLKWPGMLKTLGRSATNCYETFRLAEFLAAQDYEIVATKEEQCCHCEEACSARFDAISYLKTTNLTALTTLDCSKLTSLTSIRQRNVLRYWLEHLQLPIPPRIKLEEIQSAVLAAAPDASPLVSWHGAEIRRYQNKLYAMTPLPMHDVTQVLPWRIAKDSPIFVLPNELGTLHAAFKVQTKQTSIDITIRFRQGGERIRPRGSKHSHSLKKLMQEWNIPPWFRDRVPLIYVGGHLTAVINYAVTAEWPEDVEVIQK